MPDEPTPMPGAHRWHDGHFQVYVKPPGEWKNVDNGFEYDRLALEVEPDDPRRS